MSQIDYSCSFLACLLSGGNPNPQYFVSKGKNQADDEPYDHGKDTEDFFRTTKEFYAAMKADSSVVLDYEITGVAKVSMLI